MAEALVRLTLDSQAALTHFMAETDYEDQDDNRSISIEVIVDPRCFTKEALRYRHIREIAIEGRGKATVGPVWVGQSWIKTRKVIVAYMLAEAGGRGDEDGFDVEPDTWVYAVVAENGTICEPFGTEREVLWREDSL